MRNIITSAKIAFISSFTMLGTLSAVTIDTGFQFTNIYQYEKLKRSDTLNFVPEEKSLTDSVDTSGINLWQFGLKGQIAPPKDHFYWDNNSLLKLLNNFYFTGFTYFGWGGRGASLSETINNFQTGDAIYGHAHMKHVTTFDIQGGLGYLFDWNCWGLGVSCGYAYDTQTLKTKRGELTFPDGETIDAPLYGTGYKTKTIWKGPWVGAELLYEYCAWTFGLGYEYHYALFTANHYLPNTNAAESEGFEEETRSNNAYGNVVYFDTSYAFCEGWVAGTSFKYQNWQAKDGRIHPNKNSFVKAGFPATTKGRANASWVAYSVSFDLGYEY